jgi:hypothetical protein
MVLSIVQGCIKVAASGDYAVGLKLLSSGLGLFLSVRSDILSGKGYFEAGK